METIVLFDPSIRSLNMGDHIISASAKKEIQHLLTNRFVIECATHAPVVTWYQNTRKNPRMRIYDEAKYKFVCGSNLLWKNLMLPRPTFNVNLWNSMPYEGCILLGVGTDKNTNKLNGYTRRLYKKILSKSFIHSVRDEATKNLLEDMGFKAINTGCPTMWKFTEDFCAAIPQSKSGKVVFTLTDYNTDFEKDSKLIDILLKNYKEVYFWVQGVFDMEYFSKFKNTDKIHIISPTLEAYSAILSMDDIEYVGTRLHAGMFALQHKKRTIILTIDDRTRSIKQSYNINCIERKEISGLEKMIYSTLSSNISINEKNISRFLAQFETARSIL